jgi:hypothetical protein
MGEMPMLTALDECLWHQLPTTFDHVGTSDPRFFDRFWFAVYAQDGSAAFQHALGVYNNMDVVDGGCVIIADGRQHNARFSRALRPQFTYECGALQVEVLEPLKRFRVRLHPGEHGTAADLEWTAVAAPEEEKPHFQRRRGRVTQHYQRFNQIGLVRGEISVPGRTFEVRDWWACRDHSWGVRPGMGVPELAEDAAGAPAEDAFFFCFLFFSTDTLAGHVQALDHGPGRRYVSIVLRDRASGADIAVDDVDVDATLPPGAKVFREVRLTLIRDGAPITLTLTGLCPSIAMEGLGYSGGWNDRRGLGARRGPAYAEHEIWDVSHPVDVVAQDGSVRRPDHRIHPVRVVGGDGSQGAGSFTWILKGDFRLETLRRPA